MLLLYVLLLHLFRGMFDHDIQRVCAAVCLLALPAAGLAVLWASLSTRYRIGAAYSFFVTLAGFAALMEIMKRARVPAWLSQVAVPLLVAVLFVTHAHAGYKKYFVDILSRESMVLKEAVLPLIEQHQRNVLVIKPDWMNQSHPRPPNVELGFYNTAIWPGAAMQFAAFVVTGELAYFDQIMIVEPANPDLRDAPDHWPVINHAERLAGTVTR